MGLEANHDFTEPPINPSEETFQTKALREVRLAGEGLLSIPLAASDALYNHTAQTAGKALLAGGMTVGLSLLTRNGAGAAVGAALAVSFASDILGNGKDVAGAFRDNWGSDRNWDKNVGVMQNSIGRFSVDLAITSAAGLATHGALGFRQAPLKLEQPGPEVPLIPGQDVRVSIMSEGRPRQFEVHLPKNFDPTRKTDVLMAFDGLLVNSEPGMSQTNGLSKQADLSNFIAVFPHAETRISLPKFKVSSWSSEGAGILTPGKFLLWGKPKYDDVNFAKDILGYLDTRVNVGKIGLAGFSEGGNMATHLAGMLPKERLLGVATVSGTILGKEAPPPPGLNAIVVLGGKDPALPPEGGAGPTSKYLSWLGHDRVSKFSRPLEQARRLARANGFSGRAEVNDNGDVVETIYPAEKSALGGEIHQYVIKDGGHTWPNRLTGGQNETLFSKVNGGIPNFNVNEKIANLIMGRKIGRDLVPYTAYTARAA